MYQVYVLCSADKSRTYVGQTADVDSRLQRHNAGLVKSTKSKRPWTVLHTESCNTRSEAMQRERWYKSPAGRKMIASLLAGGT